MTLYNINVYNVYPKYRLRSPLVEMWALYADNEGTAPKYKEP